MGRVGGGIGTGKGTGKSMRKLCRNYPLAIYPLVSPLVLALLCMWCSDCRHNADTDFDGEPINFVVHMQIEM